MHRIHLANVHLLARAVLIVAVLLAVVIVPCPAHGQDADDFPQPLTTRQLEVQADWLSMSDEQRLAIQAAHDRYIAEYDRLQQERIRPLAESTRDFRRMAMTNPGNFDNALRDLRSIVASIALLDDQLFSEIEQVLTPEQAERLPRVRDARERQRHMHLLTSLNDAMRGGARVDLTEIVGEIELTPEQLTEFDTLLAPYEQQFTSRLRGLYNKLVDSFRSLVRELESNGVTGEIDWSDRSERRRIALVYETLMRQQRNEIMQEAAALAQFNRRSARDLAMSLEPQIGRQFLDAYHFKAYPAAIGKSPYIDERISNAADSEAIDESQREAILALGEQTWITRSAVVEQVIDLFEESYAAGRILDFNPRRRNRDSTGQQEQLTALTARINEINAAAINTLEQILGAAERDAEIAAKKAEAAAKDGQWGEFEIVINDAGDGTQIATLVRSFAATEGVAGRFADAFLASPMTRSDIERIKRVLPISEDQHAIVDALYSDYLESFEVIDEQINQPLLESQQESWRIEGERKQQVRPSMEHIDRRLSLRQTGMQQVLAADDTFFGDLELLIGNDAQATQVIELLELARERRVHTTEDDAVRRWYNTGQRSVREWRVDLTNTALDAGVPITRPDITTCLLEHEKAVVPMVREHFNAAIAARHAMDQSDAAGSESASREDRRDRLERLRAATAAMDGCMGQIAQMNLAARDAVLEALGDDPVAYDFLDAYNRQAFPDVFKDGRSLLGTFNTILAMPDLDDNQRRSVQELAAEYRSGYFAQCDGMIAIYRNYTEPIRKADSRSNRWRLASEQEEQLERLRFLRNELSDKMRQRLRVVLNDEQLARLPGLHLSGEAPTIELKKGIIDK